MEEVARVVLALEEPEVAEEVLHFLDRSGKARVVGTAGDPRQLAEAVRQLEPDAVVAAPALVGSVSLNGSALLALDTTQSVSSLRRAIRAGARGFYLWPAEREELALAAGRLRPVADPALVDRGSVVAVFGPRGGEGATFVATHLAAALSKRERSCVLVDLDAEFADVTAALGVPSDESVRTLADLLPVEGELGPGHLEEVVWRHPAGFGALLAPGETQAPSVRARHYLAAIEAARAICDVVVLHVPRGLDEIARTGLEAADRVVVILQLDVLSFRAAKRAIASLELHDRCVFVVSGPVRSEISPKDVERAFGASAVAVIPADRAVVAAQDRGRLLPMRGRTWRAIDRIARVVSEENS